MKIIFLGTGEAFDENVPNNSHLVITEKTKLLLDCGYSVPQQFWKFNSDPNFLDAIYISHHHADHSFGLPAILMRMWEDGRKRKLTIFGFNGLRNYMEFAYKDFQKKFKYKINLVEVQEGSNVKFQDIKMSFQKTVHSGQNLAVKITDGKNSYAYSGDGSPIAGSNFYRDLDLFIAETYLYDQGKIGHASVVGAIKFSEENNIKCLALTHLNRDFRKNELPKIKETIKSDKVRIVIPEPLDEYNL
ncbi:MAG: ribonuclease Z [Candidatus Staskawiczbacteria bacterium]|nr:ribonuclease Z [Candidatus Staskawiczbacteria bacterium]